MNFENNLPDWENEGTEPSAELKEYGFQVGYKPPAGVFNWFWSKVTKAIRELQAKLRTRTIVWDAYTEDGLIYYAPVPDFDDEVGNRITVMPARTCEMPDFMLSINDVGYGTPKIRNSSGGYNYRYSKWFVAGAQYTFIVTEFEGERFLSLEGSENVAGIDLTGVVPINLGGTGAYNAEAARKNIGAAPSGYGLGEENGKPCTDCNAAVLPALYCLSGESTVNAPSEYFSMRFGALVVEKRHAAIYQKLTYNNIVAKRYSTDSGATWEPWEFDNPPMNIGVEYRTTERWEGAPVYTTIVDCGKTVANDKIQIVTDIQCGSVIRIGGKIGGYATPFIYSVLDSRYTTWASAHNQNGVLQVNVYAEDDTGDMAAKIQVWYTK